jgi:hypothetical protein
VSRVGLSCRESIAGWRSRELRVAAAKLPDGRQSGLAERPDRGRCSAKHASLHANFELSHPRPRLSLTLTRARADKSTLPASPGLSPNAVTHFAADRPTRRASATCLLTSARAESRVVRNVFGILNRARPRSSPFLLITGGARFSAASIRRDFVYSNFASRKLYWKLAKAGAGGRLRLHTHTHLSHHFLYLSHLRICQGRSDYPVLH